MDRLWRLQGSAGKKAPAGQYSSMPAANGRAEKKQEQKKLRRLAPAPAKSAGAGSEAAPMSSAAAAAAEAEYVRAREVTAVEMAAVQAVQAVQAEMAEMAAEVAAVLEGASRGMRFRLRLFNVRHVGGMDLRDWHEARGKEAAAVSEHLHKLFTPDLYHHRHDLERVLRVWIPSDPDESPLLGERTHVRTVHHKSRAHIVRLVEDQLEATRRVYAIRQKYLGSLTASIMGEAEGEAEGEGEGDVEGAGGSGAPLPDNPFGAAKMAQTVLSLRLKGVEVTQYEERPERIEVYFEDVEVKMAARDPFGG
ncbi:hypothetical protein LTR36_005854 [Oleoguttula mirabilis]|uniref:CDT1 Geminin-binding domain-containing protein n=1 Tax=Oleoguttula mirabilis TaxID=1507867 RepID=A0AAV9JD83_9PEZI|nr:hypothetical protein LTR36_005854 [Oleoguttula mirabilis]